MRIGRLQARPHRAGTDGEGDQRDNVEALDAERVGEKRCRWRRDSLGQDIGREDPLHAVDIGAKGGLQARDGDVDNGLVQDAHEHP